MPAGGLTVQAGGALPACCRLVQVIKDARNGGGGEFGPLFLRRYTRVTLWDAAAAAASQDSAHQRTTATSSTGAQGERRSLLLLGLPGIQVVGACEGEGTGNASSWVAGGGPGGGASLLFLTGFGRGRVAGRHVGRVLPLQPAQQGLPVGNVEALVVRRGVGVGQERSVTTGEEDLTFSREVTADICSLCLQELLHWRHWITGHCYCI